MKPTAREKAFADKVQAILSDDTEPLNPEERARMVHQRLAALEVAAAGTARRRGARPTTRAVALVIAAAMVIMAFVLILRPPPAAPVPASLIADMDILSGADDMDFFADLDFYHWLAEATAHADPK